MSALKLVTRGVKQIKQTNLSPRWGGTVGVIDPPNALIDPFIFLVHHVHSFRKGENTGFPPHPHRGFETVTYTIEGGFDHGDSRGNKGRYGNGDVQWLTTGQGVLHSEMFVTDDTQNPKFNGFQLWLNLAAKDKMCEPGYTMMWNKDIPEVTLTPSTPADGSAPDVNEEFNSIVTEGQAWLKIIHGKVNGTVNVTPRKTIVNFFHVKLHPKSTWLNYVPSTNNAFAYIMSGEATVGTQTAKRASYVIFGNDGDKVEIRNAHATEPLEFVYLDGVPLKEPFAHQGPFVMNTREQLMQAFTDLQMGKFGDM